ncbi:SIMPL domain-containing protein [Rhizobium sp. L1K21]|uniref:SIMPL domain-containing protein n=1 Tax=Rhizobium sp. L1K21 TaxID=2954933 RepID=UPI002092B911|nr:SIMPL domain-containing protein [Rhizobium sp. L1K21]MCO6185527.1 SIMPL domain-containing protein [Rhizobium sp. L1K21]
MKNWLFAGVVLAVATATSVPAIADEAQPGQITVSGHGEISAKPDMAVVQFGVQKVEATARAALDANNEAMTKVIALLKEAGVEEKNIQTSGFSISPQMDYRSDSSTPGKITGYQVRNSVTVKVTDLASIGKLLDSAVDAGLNEGGQIAFTNQDMRKLTRQAETRAVKDALEKAKLLAEAAGVKPGKIISINESGGAMPYAPKMERMAFDAAPSAVPVESGENTYEANVNVTIAIDQ